MDDNELIDALVIRLKQARHESKSIEEALSELGVELIDDGLPGSTWRRKSNSMNVGERYFGDFVIWCHDGVHGTDGFHSRRGVYKRIFGVLGPGDRQYSVGKRVKAEG